MREHHQRAIDRFVGHIRADPTYLAVILGGSIARGAELENSDIDVYLVVTDEEFARRRKVKDYFYLSREFCDYPGGYVDGEVIDRNFLEQVAERGPEPWRATFAHAIVVWSRLPELDALLKRIAVYPEHEQRDKMLRFLVQMRMARWFALEAEKRDNAFLLSWAAVRVVLFGYRLILAHNKILFPSYKWLTVYVARAPDKPPQLLELGEQLMRKPNREDVDAFCECILGFREWEMPGNAWQNRFIEDSEWNWLAGRPPIEDA